MTVVVKNLSEQIFSVVRERIVNGMIVSGAPIGQDALAAELGVSKIPLREAFVRLEQEGLLVARANRGFFVRELSSDEAEEVYALRLRLEPEAIAFASRLATADEQATAKLALAALDEGGPDGSVDFGRLNREFHLSLVRTARNPLTVQIIERLQVISERYVKKHLELPGRQGRMHKEHHAMLKAWLLRDADKAAHLAYDHIEKTLKDLRKEFLR